MKQRRGSVENVAETLMMALAASGESQENIAKVIRTLTRVAQSKVSRERYCTLAKVNKVRRWGSVIVLTICDVTIY